MDALFDQSQNIQRIRYEAFSKFAAEINKCGDYELIGAVLAGHLKFIIDSFIFRIYFHFDNTPLTFTVFRGACSIQSEITDLVTSFEQPAITRGLPFTLSKQEIDGEMVLNNTIYSNPKVNCLSLLPTLSVGYELAVTNAQRVENISHESDFKFLRLISDIIGGKLYQLSLKDQIGKKSLELERKNTEITNLNRTLEDRVLQRTEELNKANHDLQKLFYSATHEFRTPLTNILGMVNLAEIYTDDEDILFLFDKCKTATLGLDKLLYKLNSLSSLGFKQSFQVVSFAEIIDETIKKLSPQIAAKNATIHITGCYQPFFVSHKDMLISVFENLIENAMIFCKNNPEISINFIQTDEGMMIDVADNGVGISSIISDKVFDMFYRGNDLSQGSGLGLYVVKQLLDNLGGRICFESTPGAGTIFKIKLPDIKRAIQPALPQGSNIHLHLQP